MSNPLPPRAIFGMLLAGALGGGGTWFVGRFALARLLATGRTGADESLGASVLSTGAVLVIIALVGLLSALLVSAALLSKSLDRRVRYLRGALVSIGFLGGALAAIYVGLYVLTK